MNLRSTPALLGLTILPLAAPATAQTYQYQFGKTLNAPEDVALYRPCKPSPEYVFVADPALGKLVRYTGNGASDPAPSATAPAFDAGPYGVAVDDSIASPNLGQVYTTTNGSIGLVWIYKDTSLVDTSGSSTDGPTCMSVEFVDDSGDAQTMTTPVGIDVDSEGNLYVVDSTHGVVIRVDAADIAHQGEVCITRNASLAFDTQFSIPTDVSVDKSGRMHVAHTCGCVPVFYPDGTLCGTGAIWAVVSTGVDAHDDYLTTRVTRADEVSEWDWELPAEEFEGKGSYGALSNPRGLEFQKYLRQVGEKRRCEDRIFVCDSGTSKIVVYGEDFTSTPTPNGAMAWWRFDDPSGATCYDSVDDNDLVLGGFPIRGDGRVGCGLSFEGNATQAWRADDDNLDIGTNDFSIEGWICARLDAGSVMFLDKLEGGFGYQAYLENGFLGFQMWSGVGQILAPTVPANYVADGKWHHVAISVRRTISPSIRLYVDGVQTGVGTQQPGDLGNASAFTLGYDGSAGDAFTGRLDEVALYDRALSPCEIMKIHKAGCAGKHGPAIDHTYCVAEVSKAGCLPSMDMVGSTSMSAADLVLVAKSVDPAALGILLYSTSGEGWVPFQDGVFCIQAPMQRTQLLQATGNGDCGGTLSFSMGEWFSSGYDPNLHPGTGVWAQFVYRDPNPTGMSGLQQVPFVLTDAVHFTITP